MRYHAMCLDMISGLPSCQIMNKIFKTFSELVRSGSHVSNINITKEGQNITEATFRMIRGPYGNAIYPRHAKSC